MIRPTLPEALSKASRVVGMAVLKHWVASVAGGAVFLAGSFYALSQKPISQVVKNESDNLSSTVGENIQKAANDTFIHWFDDVQADETSIFERPGQEILPNTVAGQWVKEHRSTAADRVKLDLKDHVNLGNAVLAGYLDLKEAVPDIVEGWTKLEEEPYSGESSIEGEVDLSFFRELQGIAYVIERLTGQPLKLAVVLTDLQRQRLHSRAAKEDRAAVAILAALK